MRTALALFLLCAVTSDAAALRLGAGPKAEDKLRRFVAGDKALRARLDSALRREALFREEARDTGLRDAVAATPATREEIIEQLPGMKAPPAGACSTFADCHLPEFAAVVEHAELLPDAVRALVRPWLLLQEARGYKTEITPASKNDALLTVRLAGLDAAPLVLNVAPRMLGGFNVWYDEPAALSALYERERALIFARR